MPEEFGRALEREANLAKDETVEAKHS